MQDELVEVADLVAEARLTVAALLRGAKLVLKEGVILSADDRKVVAHVYRLLRAAKLLSFVPPSCGASYYSGYFASEWQEIMKKIERREDLIFIEGENIEEARNVECLHRLV